MEKNKIALVTYSLSAGGLERVVANSTFLFEKMGYEVHLYVLESKIDYPFTGKLHTFNIDNLSMFSKIKAYRSIRNSLKNNQFQLIIDHRYRLNGWTEIMWQKFIYNKETVLNYVHSSYIYNYLFKSIKFNEFLFKNRPFICVSKGIEQLVVKNFPLLKTTTIYNFVDVKLSKTPLNVSEKYILSIARMDHENVKQVDVLLECYSKSILPAKKIRLVILGDGVRLEEMKNLANKLNVSDLVDFKGFEPYPENYLKNALFTVLTSKYEGLPTVLVESLLMKTPVISFDCETGPNEIIVDRFNGLLIENQNQTKMIDGMNELITNKELYQSLKQNAQNSVEQFQLKAICIQWEQYLNDKL